MVNSAFSRFAFLIACLLPVIVVAQSVPNLSEADKKQRLSLEVDDLVGPIKIVEVYETQISKTTPESLLSESASQHVRSVLFDTEGKITDVVKPRGNTLRCGTKDPEPTKTVQLDALGRKVEEVFDYKGIFTIRYNYEYDPQGQTRFTRMVVSDKTVLWKWDYRFDAQGREIEQVTYDSDKPDVPSSRQSLIRNEKGLVIESVEYSATKSPSVKRTSMAYEYDEFGNWITCTESRLVTENGQSFFQPSKKLYRTLIYYPEK